MPSNRGQPAIRRVFQQLIGAGRRRTGVADAPWRDTMKPSVPILTITFQIPILPELDADTVMEAIGQQIAEAIDSAREQSGAEDEEQEMDERAPAASEETLEPFTMETQDD